MEVEYGQSLDEYSGGTRGGEPRGGADCDCRLSESDSDECLCRYAERCTGYRNRTVDMGWLVPCRDDADLCAGRYGPWYSWDGRGLSRTDCDRCRDERVLDISQTEVVQALAQVHQQELS